MNRLNNELGRREFLRRATQAAVVAAVSGGIASGGAVPGEKRIELADTIPTRVFGGYREGVKTGNHVQAFDLGMKMVAGGAKWTDYVLEGRVMLKSEARGNAGLIFCVNDAGPGYDQMRGYYVGLDARKLYLGKMNNNWQPLAEFDLVRLDCKVMPDVWNQIRVVAEGPRIRVWLNRMHPSADPDRGLRIDFTDEKEPILSGAIGVRAHLVPAWFDHLWSMSPACS